MAADSLFTFTFTATSGDAWGGFFVSDSAAHAPGNTLATAFGTYTVGAETETGLDLTTLGLEDGGVFVEWYWDAATAGFLPTRNGPAVASGTAGLGSETDAAWSGTAWDIFGAGGAGLADAAVGTGDALFTWTFFASSGDRWRGVLFDAAAAFAPGDTFATAWGSYLIDTERPVTPGEAAPRGTVRLTEGYLDAGSGTWLNVAGAWGATDAGTAGLGSETGAAWNGEGWAAFGAGGAFQADLDRDSSFSWYFHDPATGDWYSGWVIEDTGRYAPGTRIPARGDAFYVITGESAFGAPSGHADGTTWISGFLDGGSGRWLETESWRAGQPLATRGLGFEADRAWDGNEWDGFSAASTAAVVVENDSVFRWYFVADGSGDIWNGRLVHDARTYDPGATIRAAGGTYVIYAEQELGRYADAPWGTVWSESYYDAASRTWFASHGATSGEPSGAAGLGSEVDWLNDGQAWHAFGRGGALQAERRLDSLYSWYFWSPGSGDITTGRLLADSALYDAGSQFNAGWGTYVIHAERELGRAGDAARGSVWMDGYYDARSDTWFAPWFGPRGEVVGTGGLGTEVDWINDGTNWFAVGQAGWLQADVFR